MLKGHVRSIIHSDIYGNKCWETVCVCYDVIYGGEIDLLCGEFAYNAKFFYAEFNNKCIDHNVMWTFNILKSQFQCMIDHQDSTCGPAQEF
jgi:hypothetical protein